MFKSKKTAFAAFVTTATVIGSPMLMQTCFMDQHDKLIEKISKQDVSMTPLQLNIETLSKSPGYLTSQIISRVSLKSNPSVCLDLKTDVKHGQLQLLTGKWYEADTSLLVKSGFDGCNYLSDLSKDPVAASLINQVFENGSPISINTIGSVLGDNLATLNSESIDVSVSGKRSEMNAKIGPINSTLKFDSNFTDIASELSVLDIQLNVTQGAKQRSLAVAAIQSEGSANKEGLDSSSKLWAGSANFSINGVEIVSDGAAVQLPVFSTQILIDVSDGEKFSETIKSQVVGLSVNDTPMGSFEFGFDVSNLGVSALDKLSRSLEDNLGNNATQPPQEIIENVKQAIADASIKFDPVTWFFDEGAFKMSLNIEVVDMSKVDINSFANPLDAIISSIESRLDVTLDKGFVEPFSKSYAMSSMLQLPESHRNADVLASLELKGKSKFDRLVERTPEAFIDNGSSWNMQLTIDKSGMKLNGQDFDPFALLALSMQQ